ncbi:uncharacterized protein (TIGR00288 family) [Heliophilum fasciatum]|uniref:Uncharacterized protein (TIGR00288 family) n=2 Tax=Heliophilum fasciatum TaxID=35700 RepID=A0A4R2RMU6_9FIRM|nr:uncharacterized protein (TIGR00288 family) [Heliophilum fasciatum]
MEKEYQGKTDRLAVLIDGDNSRAKLIEPMIKEITKYGTAHVKRIYGDWTSSKMSSWKDKLHKHAIHPVQQFAYTTGKNATDSALIIDAMDLLYTRSIDGFCIVSSDSDFTRLASRIRESGLFVIGFGEQKTPEAFVKACDKFIYTEILESSDSGDSDFAKPKPRLFNGNDDPRDNEELVRLLKDAYEAVASEDSWARLSNLGNQLTKLYPSFDSRNFGYKKLGELIRAVDLFEIKATTTKDPGSKILYIKLK